MKIYWFQDNGEAVEYRILKFQFYKISKIIDFDCTGIDNKKFFVIYPKDFQN